MLLVRHPHFQLALIIFIPMVIYIDITNLELEQAKFWNSACIEHRLFFQLRRMQGWLLSLLLQNIPITIRWGRIKKIVGLGMETIVDGLLSIRMVRFEFYSRFRRKKSWGPFTFNQIDRLLLIDWLKRDFFDLWFLIQNRPLFETFGSSTFYGLRVPESRDHLMITLWVRW